MRNKTIGIIILIIGLGLSILDDVENNFLSKLYEYRSYIATMGGAFIGVGFFGKKKIEKNNT